MSISPGAEGAITTETNCFRTRKFSTYTIKQEIGSVTPIAALALIFAARVRIKVVDGSPWNHGSAVKV
jgi:hypothetical protein